MDRQTKLPEFVGKKIVEALKQDENSQSTSESAFVPSFSQKPVEQDTIYEKRIDLRATAAATSQPDFRQDDKIEITDLELPDNVMMLVKLINQLPTGVNRQIGAQIIRQTIEAMGISMKSVLAEAQYIQEDLGNSTQDCQNTIEEYKNNIKILEQKINTYKKQASKLGELINLFVMTIK